MRRRFAVLAFALPLVVIMLVVTPRVSPYADAKTYMLMAPGVTLMAAVGAAALARWQAAAGLARGGRAGRRRRGLRRARLPRVQLAPTDRMEALHDLDERSRGRA